MAQPKVTPLTKLHLSESAFKRLSHTVRRIEEGTTLDIRSPFFKGQEDENILASWDAVFQPRSGTLRPTLMRMEEASRSKFGPRSIAKPWSERKASTSATFNAPHLDVSSLDASVPWAVTNGRRPLALAEAAKYIVPSTSSGLPLLMKKREALEVTLRDHQALLGREDPAMLYTRTQEGGKTRDVFGYPFADTLLELSYFQGVLADRRRVLGEVERAALLGPDAVEAAMYRVLGFAVKRSWPVVSVDFSHYDATVSPDLAESALRRLLSHFQDDYRIDYLIHRFQTIGLVTPDGVVMGTHGVPSGSVFTNEVDSEVQLLTAGFFEPGHEGMCTVQGDDGVHVVSDRADLLRRFKRWGLEINDEKSHTSEDEAIYLQCYFHVDDEVLGTPHGAIAGVYPTYRALNRIVHMERWTDLDEGLSGDDFFAIRTISILENCKRHPMFSEFVKFVAGKAEKGLEFSQSGLGAYVESIKTKGRAGIQHSWGENLRGINSFETLKVLRG